ncbi:MAG: (2Fe-2S) ferredoxin domain-containing protein [Deltaproteobacteria bacterium]|nr:(2Fe-2S) ferredoxin domain-containing protein [Deltaproteobacteria bacterium]
MLMAFAKEFEQQDLFGRFALVQTGCMGPCFEGPIAAVFPDNVFWTWPRQTRGHHKRST